MRSGILWQGSGTQQDLREAAAEAAAAAARIGKDEHSTSAY